MKVFTQKHRGEFANLDPFTTLLGFREKGYLDASFGPPG
jgi:hypothetical protein